MDIEATRRDGSGLPAYLAVPSNGSGPGLLVLHAYWGLTAHYRRMCNWLAAEGFVALAPSLFDGRSSDEPAEAEALMATLTDEGAERDLDAVVNALLARPERLVGPIGAVGFSMGGWAATKAAALRPEIGAVVAFYGISGGSDYSSSRAAFQVHYAEPSDIDEQAQVAFANAVLGKGLPLKVYSYPSSRHGFANDDHPEDFDPAAAELAWSRALEFLRRHLAK